MIGMNLTQFHPESDITPLDSGGEELETNPKFNYIDSIYIYIGDKGQMWSLTQIVWEDHRTGN